ncbi:G patch domain-containing protein 11-like [Chenopodium quinoa]|uniref:G patch domain-containing protein 11-like n=1 Tax=Chenopodium quinoa TaxID=63459 RepID=UPI000B77A2EB|nr:G patch domain-containing protein 11-like [Chenopodium quinoa]XP_021724006.1 G patch domain-containing protein 11-like [Chenopodium quinoa]
MADTEATNAKPKSPEEDEDEDYMGDLSKFITTESSQLPKPKKLAPKTLPNSSQQPSKKKPKFQSWQHQKELKQLEEDKQTLENLQSAIPQSNIGFKLLKQMGYTPGKGLGKEGSVGREEPIGLEIRRSRAGIGREDPAKERVKREKVKEVWKKKTEEVMLEDFGVRQKMQWKSKRVVINYNKAKAALDQLENREPAVEPEKEEGDDGEDEEEEEEVITEEDLLELLEKLREEHRYCLFCGCQYESMEALLSNCPGRNEDDH